MWGKLGNWSFKELLVMGLVSLFCIAALALFFEALDLIVKSLSAGASVLWGTGAVAVFISAVLLLKKLHKKSK